MSTARSFQFPLDPVLRQRKQQEQDKQRKLAEIMRRQIAIEGRLREIQQQIVASKRELSGRLSGQVDTNAIRAQANMAMALDVQARQLALELAEVYRIANAAREELIGASKRRKSIERLRERRFEAWKYELRRIEEKESDDLTMTRIANRGGNGP